MWTREELAWLAGLFEGEGSLGTSGGRGMVLRIGMTDRDVVDRAQQVAGFGRVFGPYPRKQPDWKPIHVWMVSDQSHVYALVVALWPWLGERRQVRAEIFIRQFANWRRGYTQLQRDAVIADRQLTGASQWVLADRHGMSRSRVQQLITGKNGNS